MDRKSNYIAGQWVAGESEIENRTPSDLSDVIGFFAQASADQLETVLDAACLTQAEWAAAGIERRYDALMAIGQTLMARSTELGELLSREQGSYAKEFHTTVRTSCIASGLPE